jgi:hypothetical protein
MPGQPEIMDGLLGRESVSLDDSDFPNTLSIETFGAYRAASAT